MKSIPIRKMLRVFPIPVPRGAREAYTVISRKLPKGNNSTCYDVIVWQVPYRWARKGKTIQALRLTCECQASKFGKPCAHILAVLKQRMPTARIWPTEPDARRQHRRYYPVLHGPNSVTTGSNTSGGVLWLVERHAHRHIRNRIT